jgi:hypothetical protein
MQVLMVHAPRARRTVVRRDIPLLPGDRKKDCFFRTLFESISKITKYTGLSIKEIKKLFQPASAQE